MAQHDYVIDNQTAPNFRSDLNNALLAAVSNNSGPSAPSDTHANMLWYDTTNNILKMRNEADDTWIDIGTLNQSTNKFEVASTSVPVGAVTAFAMNTAPSGWLECDGSAVSRSTYSDLFAAIGTTFGVGDGSTTFNLPDLRGEFIRGWDNTRGVDSGRSFGSAQTDEFEAHTHTYTRTNIALTDGASFGSEEFEPTGTSTVATGSAGGASETRPRNIALMYCIKT